MDIINSASLACPFAKTPVDLYLINCFQAIRVLGLLGALDPYKHKVFLGQIDSSFDSGAVLSQSDSKQDIDNQGIVNALSLVGTFMVFLLHG